MKSIVQAWRNTSLILRIAIGIVIGTILGVAFPQAGFIKVLGNLFVGALKGVAPILVFVLVISALLVASGGIRKRFRLIIALYMISTLIAALIAVLASFTFPVNLVLNVSAVQQAAPQGIGEVVGNLLTNIVANPFSALMNANYISILFWAVLFGLALKTYASQATIDVISQTADAVSHIVRWVISCAPIGICGLVFDSVSSSGLSIFVDYGRLLAVLLGCMVFMVLVVDPLIVFVLLRMNPYPLLFKCLKESGITAFFTRSSAANIPVNMALCEKLGLDKDVYSVSIPLGATINMDGAAITITVMTLATVHTMGMTVDIPSALVLSVLATVAACGASGVAGGSLLLIPMACSMFGISNDIAMQVVAIGFIIGVLQDSCETALNSSSDVLLTATAEFYEWKKQGKEIKF